MRDAAMRTATPTQNGIAGLRIGRCLLRLRGLVVERLADFLAGLEHRHALRRHRHALAGTRIAADAGAAFLGGERAEAADLHALAAEAMNPFDPTPVPAQHARPADHAKILDDSIFSNQRHQNHRA